MLKGAAKDSSPVLRGFNLAPFRVCRGLGVAAAGASAGASAVAGFFVVAAAVAVAV